MPKPRRKTAATAPRMASRFTASRARDEQQASECVQRLTSLVPLARPIRRYLKNTPGANRLLMHCVWPVTWGFGSLRPAAAFGAITHLRTFTHMAPNSSAWACLDTKTFSRAGGTTEISAGCFIPAETLGLINSTEDESLGDMPRTNAGTKFTVRAVTPDLWPALEELFGKWGASNGCWCMYWRVGGAYRGRREENKQALRNIVASGSPPGLLAFDGKLAVGWCQLTPRDAIPWLDRRWWYQRVDALPVWSISCFFVRRGYRRQRVMTQLIFAALKAAKRAGAAALEAYPIDTDVPNRTSNTFTGTAVAFARAGFKEVARRAPARPIMRHDLKAIPVLMPSLPRARD
jgi:GNAT superfamily N-acetyltransferase